MIVTWHSVDSNYDPIVIAQARVDRLDNQAVVTWLQENEQIMERLQHHSLWSALDGPFDFKNLDHWEAMPEMFSSPFGWAEVEREAGDRTPMEAFFGEEESEGAPAAD